MADNLKLKSIPSIIVTGLVSSGKSTLVNAMLGYNLMPTNNLACTAMTISIVDNSSNADSFAVYMDDNNKPAYISREDVNDKLINYNRIASTGRFIVYEKMEGISKGKKSFVLTDTPGIDDAITTAHIKTTYKFIKESAGCILLYVSHVKCCGSDDELKAFQRISKIMKENRSVKGWVVAINGTNFIDKEKNSEEEFKNIVLSLANSCCLPIPKVYMISALGALLCRRVLAGEQLNEREKSDFNKMLHLFSAGKSVEQAQRQGRQISRKAIERTLYDTGIPSLEDYLHTII